MLKSTHKSAAVSAAAQTDPPLAEGWTEHKAPSGHQYYYNSSTKKSTYTRPVATPAEPEELLIDFNATLPDATLHATVQALDEFHRNKDPRGPSHFTGGRAYQERPRRGHGGDRPKSKQSITGAEPWFLVKTRYGRRFVHNTDTKQSLWKFPQEVMMAVIEMDRKEWEATKLAEQKEKDEKDPETAKGRDAVARANAMRKLEQEAEERQEESSDYEEVEVTDEEEEEASNAASKRQRLEAQEPNQPTGPVELNEDDIEWQLAQMEEDEYGDAYDDEEEGLPITEEDNVALFRSLLDDAGISPYTTFEKVIENEAMIEDDRYTSLPNMHRRREAFTEWSRDRIAELQEQKALKEQSSIRNLDPKVTYLQFLHKHATPKLYWPEFKRKYKKSPAMLSYDISDKDREKLYRDLVAKLKLGESDRRKELLGALKGAKGDLERNSSMTDLPDAILKDVRFYLVDEEKRVEIVEGYLSTL